MPFDVSWLRLIAITDSLHDGIAGLSSRAIEAVRGGATMIQLRLPEEPPRPASLRRIVPDNFVIGASVGADEDVARAAGANYAYIGPVHGARQGEDALGVVGFAQLAKRFGGPAVAIGGVKAENVAALMSAGASGVAVISAVFRSPDAAAAARAMRAAQDASET